VWNDDQRALYARVIAGEAVPPVIGLDALPSVTVAGWEAAWRYLPSLLRASLITIVLSCLSMGLAVILGVAIASGRVYGGRLTRGLLTGFVGVIGGPPVPPPSFLVYH